MDTNTGGLTEFSDFKEHTMNDDGGRYEAAIAMIEQLRSATDGARLRIGLRAARLARDKNYGAGIVRRIAADAGISRSALYEYIQTVEFLVAWRGLSARRIFSDFPELSYTHIRIARTLEFEAAIDALLAVAIGDDEYPEFDERLPMSPDTFRAYVGVLRGHNVPEPPLFDEAGHGAQVFAALARRMGLWRDKNVRAVVRLLQSADREKRIEPRLEAGSG